MSELKLDQEEIDNREFRYTGTSPTGHKEFDRDGYLVLRNVCDPKEFASERPEKIGKYFWYDDNINVFDYEEDEGQVHECTSRYNYPPYIKLHKRIGRIVEKEIGRKLYTTYFHDRYYSTGQILWAHLDRPACEISVTIHLESNIKNPWPIWVKSPDTYDNPNPSKRTRIVSLGENRSIILNAGDMMIYKGCERPHWREQLPKEYVRVWNIQYSEDDGDMSSNPPSEKLYNIPQNGRRMEKEGLYYHQAFFHYVLADGIRVDRAYDNNIEGQLSMHNIEWN